MTYNKRDYSKLFAIEDCRRVKSDEITVSQAIVKAAEKSPNLKKFANLVKQRAPRSGISTPLKTTEAWQRRVGGASLAILASVATELGLIHETDNKSKNDVLC